MAAPDEVLTTRRTCLLFPCRPTIPKVKAEAKAKAGASWGPGYIVRPWSGPPSQTNFKASQARGWTQSFVEGGRTHVPVSLAVVTLSCRGIPCPAAFMRGKQSLSSYLMRSLVASRGERLLPPLSSRLAGAYIGCSDC